MAGFWTGLVHGTLVCGATLAALSLALPRDAGDKPDEVAGNRAPDAAASVSAHDEDDSGALTPGTDTPPAVAADAPADGGRPPVPARMPEPAAAKAPLSAESAGAAAAVSPAVLPDMAAAEAVPATGASGAPWIEPVAVASPPASATPAERLPDPIGSDFRRGSDDPPRVPEASPAPVERHVPRTVAASEEGAPPPAPAPGELPPVATAPAAPGLLAPDNFSPEPLVAPADEAPIAIASPGRMAAPGLDPLPETGQAAATSSDAQPATGAGSDGVSPSAAQGIPRNRAASTEAAALANEPRPAASSDGAAMASRAPRPTPDLSIPRALFAPDNGRAAPSLPQPAAATPPAPDLSDLNPGVSR